MDKAPSPARTLPDWIVHRSMSAPRAPAIVAGGHELDYASLAARVDRLAGVLREAGVTQGDRVALLAGNGLPFAEAVHAVPGIGAILVPLNLRLSPAELAWQLGDCGARLLLCAPETKALATAVQGGAVQAIELGEPTAAAPGDLLDVHGADDVHSIIYTSGTTGRPKGAMLTFGNFWASASASAFNLGVLPGDRWLACMPLFHVGGLSILLRSAIYGTAAHIVPGFDEREVNSLLRTGGITLLSVVSTMLSRMLDADELAYPPAVRAVLVGGGPVPPNLLRRALERGLPVLQTYGLTEAASQVTTLAPADALSHLGSAGKPMVVTRLRVDGSPGEPGEILVTGPTVTPGYYGNPDATSRALRDGWLHTGDIGALDADGYLRVLDRRDDLIVTGGENVYPAEVEAALLQHPAVAGAAVVGLPDERWGQVVAAMLVPRGDCDTAAVGSWLRGRIAGYKAPRRYRLIDALPATASGKTQRHRVRELFADVPPAPSA